MADIEELLFSETDGSCAYCGIKDYRVLTIHHIVQQEPKDESYGNKIVLCHNCHQLYHEGKGPSQQDLESIKKRLILRTLTQQGVNALKEAYRKGLVVASPYMVNHLIELQFLRLSEVLSMYETDCEIDSQTDRQKIVDAVYELTERGRQFAEKWGLR